MRIQSLSTCISLICSGTSPVFSNRRVLSLFTIWWPLLAPVSYWDELIASQVMLVKPAQASMGVHFLLSKSLAPTYCGLVKVSLAITALTKNFNAAATQPQQRTNKKGTKCPTRWAPSGPSLNHVKLGELHMGPSSRLVTPCWACLFVFCLFVCCLWCKIRADPWQINS